MWQKKALTSENNTENKIDLDEKNYIDINVM